MKDNQFTYAELLELGFVREDYSDKVHFDHTGYDPFRLEKVLKIEPNFGEVHNLSWDQETMVVTLFRIKSDGTILGKLKIYNKTQLLDTIKFYEK